MTYFHDREPHQKAVTPIGEPNSARYQYPHPSSSSAGPLNLTPAIAIHILQPNLPPLPSPTPPLPHPLPQPQRPNRHYRLPAPLLLHHMQNPHRQSRHEYINRQHNAQRPKRSIRRPHSRIIRNANLAHKIRGRAGSNIRVPVLNIDARPSEPVAVDIHIGPIMLDTSCVVLVGAEPKG